VDRQTLETSFSGVYAIGDVTGVPLAIGKPARFDGHGECFIEIGEGKVGFGSGNFYAEPAPEIKLRQPSRSLHLGKVAFEKYWLSEWF